MLVHVSISSIAICTLGIECFMILNYIIFFKVSK